MNREAAVVDPQPGGDIAAARGDQKDDRHGASRAAIGLRDLCPAGESAPSMLVGEIETELAEHPSHALMGLVQFRIEGECRLVLGARTGDVLLLAQQVAEIHARHDIVGMMRDRLRIRGARRRSIPARPGEGRELVERIEISRILPQHLDVGLLRSLVLSLSGKRARPLEPRGDARRFMHVDRCSSRMSARPWVDTLAPRANHDPSVMKRNARRTVRKKWTRIFLRAEESVSIRRQLKTIVKYK
jgi:hypothetical protein